MAMTLTELLGESGHSATGQDTGGAVKVVIPPAAIYDAGPLALVVWMLEQLMAAQEADPGPTTPTIITRAVNALSTTDGNKIQYRYTVQVTVDDDDIAQNFAENVDDNFN